MVSTISDGANNKYDSVFAPYDFFYAWRKVEDGDTELNGINSLVTMVKGLFRKDRLLAVIKDFIYFPDNSDKDLKIVCRYPQFFAANKLFNNIKEHIRPEGDGKGGIYFGATGCGKSYTMMFLTRMLMKSKFFRSPTIIIITDRATLTTSFPSSSWHPKSISETKPLSALIPVKSSAKNSKAEKAAAYI